VNNEIRQFLDVSIGMAVALDDGLVVPVLKNVDKKNVIQIAKETKEIAAKAKEGKLTPDDMSGGTFTISNMGMLHVDMFTAIINPSAGRYPAVGALKTAPVFAGHEFIPRLIMKIVVSSDQGDRRGLCRKSS